MARYIDNRARLSMAVHRLLPLSLLVVVAIPAKAALSIDIARDLYNASPEHGALISADLSMPCVDVMKEEAEGLANPFSLGSERPPALFKFEVWPEDTGNWSWETVTPPDAPAYVAYYVPDFEYCHANPNDSLHYHASFSVQPSWDVAAETTMDATISAFVAGTDAWFYGPNPHDEVTVQVAVQPALAASLESGSPWPAALEIGVPHEFRIPLSLRSNYDVSASVNPTGVPTQGVCVEGFHGSVHHPVNITSSPPILINRTVSTSSWGGNQQHTVSVFVMAGPASSDVSGQCQRIQQTADVSIRIIPARIEEPDVTAVVLNSTLTWTLETARSRGEREAGSDQHAIPGPPLALVLIGISMMIVLARLRRRA